MRSARFYAGWLVAILVLFTLSCSKKSEEQLYQEAKAFETEVNYAKARNSYKELSDRFPESANATEARSKSGLMEQAQQLDEAGLLAEIESYESREEFENALILYNSFISRFPQSERMDEMLHKVGLLYLNTQEQYQRSIAAYERLLREHGQSKYAPQAQFMIGYIYANHLKDLGKAREAYETFRTKYPDHELIASVNWELEHLGQDISDIDIFANGKSQSGQNTDQAAGQSSSNQSKTTPGQ